jgi:CheY-like chemotaxis protein
MDERPPPLPILVVDDDDADRMAVAAVLAPLGVEVVEAAGGEEALRLLLERDFSCVVLDLMMPRLSGLETAVLIRERDRTRGVPIVLLTGYDEDGIRLLPGYRPIEADYLRKPVDPDELRAKIAGRVFGLDAAALSARAASPGPAGASSRRGAPPRRES